MADAHQLDHPASPASAFVLGEVRLPRAVPRSLAQFGPPVAGMAACLTGQRLLRGRQVFSQSSVQPLVKKTLEILRSTPSLCFQFDIVNALEVTESRRPPADANG
jgi:hypothetical protein